MLPQLQMGPRICGGGGRSAHGLDRCGEKEYEWVQIIYYVRPYPPAALSSLPS